MTESNATPTDRAAVHRALGDERRLCIVDALRLSDRSPGELGALAGLGTNLLAFHLNVLEEVGLIGRATSQGDARRRYVTLDRERLAWLVDPRPWDEPVELVLFLCTANSARSQLAAGLWHARTGAPALSAGTAPAERVHPLALEVAARRGLDLEGATPTGYHDLDVEPDLVVSVCDRAHESSAGVDAPLLHWSIPDPVGGDRRGFERTFDAIDAHVRRLALAARPAPARADERPRPVEGSSDLLPEWRPPAKVAP